MFADLPFLWACHRAEQHLPTQLSVSRTKSFYMLYCIMGLLLLDNLHFQYNSMMYGLLLLSLVYVYEGRTLKSALMFAVLLQFKHIFLYSAPAFGVLYLRQSLGRGRYRLFFMLTLQTASVFLISYLPIIGFEDPIGIGK